MKPIAVALISAVLLVTGCNQDAAGPENPGTPQTVPVPGGYEITLPANYDVHDGVGIDSRIFQAYREDGKVLLQIETGMTPLDRFSDLPDVYRFPNRVEFSANGVVGAYFYEILEPRIFREIWGTIIWGASSGTGYQQVLYASHSADTLPEVLEILSTLKLE